MYTPVTVVEVRIWQKTVGAVALDPRLGYYAFEYGPAFTRSGVELAPITMPLAAAREPFVFPDLPDLSYRRLPGMLADALPDDFGNTLIDAWMARDGVSASRITLNDTSYCLHSSDALSRAPGRMRPFRMSSRMRR